MKKLILLIFLLSGCAHRLPIPTPTETPIPPVGDGSGIHFSPITGTAKEIARVQAAEKRINEMIGSECFQNYFLKRALIQTNGMTRQGVVDFIRKASISIPIVYYYKNDGVVGYREPPSLVVYVNRKFHDSYSVCSEASGNGHEMLHDLEFDHDFERTARRPYSVPYSWNAMTLECCEE